MTLLSKEDETSNPTAKMSQRTRSMLARVLKQMAGLVEKTDTKRKEAEEAAMIDPLTKVFKREGYKAIFPTKALRPALMDGLRFAYLVVDANGLKKINDTYGHLAGDKYLSIVAETLTLETRSKGDRNDFVFRFGGDEFVVILTETKEKEKDLDEQGVRLVVQRFFDKLSNYVVDPNAQADSFIRERRPEEPPTYDLSLSVGALLVNCLNPKMYITFARYFKDWDPNKTDFLYKMADDLETDAKERSREIRRKRQEPDHDPKEDLNPNKLSWTHFQDPDATRILRRSAPPGDQ
jgi:diguanylate cyclase (GGDEF)-like protein